MKNDLNVWLKVGEHIMDNNYGPWICNNIGRLLIHYDDKGQLINNLHDYFPFNSDEDNYKLHWGGGNEEARLKQNVEARLMACAFMHVITRKNVKKGI